MEQFNKPTTVEASDLHDNIMKLINESKLHPLILETITRDIHSEIASYVSSLTKREKYEYQKELESAAMPDIPDIEEDEAEYI